MNYIDPDGQQAPQTGTPSYGGDWISSLIGAGVSVYNTIEAKKAAERQNRANRELAEYQYSKQLEMWNMQNEYNSPMSQMQRYKDGGLNPNLIYGNGSSSAGNSAQLPQYSAPQMQSEFAPISGIQGVLGMYQDFRMKQAQIDNTNAQTKNTEARTASEALRPSLLGVQTESQKFDLDTKDMLRPYQAQTKEQMMLQSKAKTQQEWQRIRLMSQQEQQNVLQQTYLGKLTTKADLQNELTASQTIFQRYKNDWMKAGVTSSDNPLLRLFTRQLSEAGILDTFSSGLANYLGRKRRE